MMNESIKGIWHDDTNLERRLNQFLDADLYTNPAYARNKSFARSIQKVRMNSRGQTLKRACAGTNEHFQWVVDKLSPKKNRRNRYDTITDAMNSQLTSKFTSKLTSKQASQETLMMTLKLNSTS